MAQNTHDRLDDSVNAPDGAEKQKSESGVIAKIKTGTATATLALALAVGATPPAVAEVPSAKGHWQVVQLKDGRNMSFAEIAQLPKKEKDEVIAEMKRSERSSFNDFELQAANQKGEQIDARIQAANQNNTQKLQIEQAANQRIEWKQEALNQSKELGKVLDELYQEQGLKMHTPELQAKNKQRWQIILDALANPRIAQGLQPNTRQTLQVIGESLVRTGNIAMMNQSILNAVKTQLH